MAAASVELFDMSPVASVIGIATEFGRVSDHLPVRFSWFLPDPRPRRTGVIPRWVAEHEEYEGVLSRFLADIDSDGPYGRLCLFKDAAHAACVILKRQLADRPARTIQGQLHWACLLYRAARSSDLWGCSEGSASLASPWGVG